MARLTRWFIPLWLMTFGQIEVAAAPPSSTSFRIIFTVEVNSCEVSTQHIGLGTIQAHDIEANGNKIVVELGRLELLKNCPANKEIMFAVVTSSAKRIHTQTCTSPMGQPDRLSCYIEVDPSEATFDGDRFTMVSDSAGSVAFNSAQYVDVTPLTGSIKAGSFSSTFELAISYP